MNVTLDIASTFDATSRKAIVSVDIAKLSPEICANLLLHGLQQKIADAASGAKKLADESGENVDAITQSLMEKALDGLYSGEWARRRESNGESEETIVSRQIMRRFLKLKMGSKSTAWADFIGLSDDDQTERLDRYAEKNAAIIADEVNAEIERRKEAAKRKATLQKKMDFAI